MLENGMVQKIYVMLFILHPTRLGHGVRSIEDLDLVKEIVRDIVLETCPTSNIATKIYENYDSHPVKKLHE